MDPKEPVPAGALPAAGPLDVAFVLAGGSGLDASALHGLPDPAIVVAADSGLDAAASHGLEVSHVVGDLDSVSAGALATAMAAGTTVERHPVDKDRTDLDLALRRVVGAGFTRCVVLGGGGGRLSHLLANAALLASDAFDDVEIRWRVGSAEVQVARPGRPVRVTGDHGDLITILAVEGAAGVATSGLRWPLAGAALEPGSTRGVSNELVDTSASVSLERGTLLVVHEPAEPVRR